MKYFFTSKLSNNDTNEFPVSVFRWRAHSGDEVLAYMQKLGYGGEADAAYITEVRKRNSQNDLVDATFGCYGYGDGGGGCTYRMAERLRRYKEIPGMPEVSPGTAAEFFAEAERARDALPVWDGEMYYENHRGTFTSQAFVKENNRKGEILLRDVELLGVLSGGYDRPQVDALWRLLLTNQFHDILPGTSIHEVFVNTRKEYAALMKAGGDMKAAFLRDLSLAYADGNCVVVWNLTSHPATGPVTAAVPADFYGVTDDAGAPVPCARREAGDGAVMEFIARDVPAVGCRRFLLTKEAHALPAVTAGKRLLENEYLRVSVGRDGALLSVTDKEAGRELMSDRGNVLTISHDKPIHESAWNLEADYRLHSDPVPADSVEVLESSPVKGAVRVTRRYNGSVIVQDYTLYAGARQLDFITHIEWKEREKVLKASFPVNIRARYSTFEVAHGAAERPTFANNPFETAMFECCAHKWVDLSETGYGAALLNNCKYGHDITGNTVTVTLMRGPVCPDRTGDIGAQDFVYSLLPHAGGWADADITNRARLLNDPLVPVYCPYGAGKPARSFFGLSAENLVIDAVKTAQNGDGVIVRVNETRKRRGEAVLTLPFAPKAVYECNLMEENERALPVAENALRFEYKPFEVKTFRLIR